MLRLEDIKRGSAVNGTQVVQIVSADPVGDNALTVYYASKSQTLFTSGEPLMWAVLNLAKVV